MNDINPLDIAVIGMACYFPESYDLEQYWKNLSQGVCSVRFYSDEELLGRGVKKSALGNPDYVKASPYFSRARLFDASFFNINPGEANIMDPQRRLFIENCWQTLEDAGYMPEKYPGKIGVFGSAGVNLYLIRNLMENRDLVNAIGEIQMIASNDKDGLPTQTSYLLNLSGPSVNINTACSSSLVAIHLARQSLLMGDSDMVLAGGSALILPENVGYVYERDSILSHDGYCRSFDDDSDGTLWGSGSGVVLLKRLSDAVADGDNIRAVIKGSAVNNDGSKKVGYTAPSVEGQSEIIVQAYASSDISPETVSYIEAHGTGTKIGDPIEVAALTKAFREFTKKKGFCGIGSVKSNIGHLGAAAGIASFIKGVLALENRKIPPTLHYKKSNKNIDFQNSPFYVNTELTDMKPGSTPLRVGVSSLGVGGTNAHIILEEAPEEFKRSSSNIKKDSVLLISARNTQQLEKVRKNLLEFMMNHKDLSIRDISYTLIYGRRDLKCKTALIADSVENAVNALNDGKNEKILNENNFLNNSQNMDVLLRSKLTNWFKGEAVDWKALFEGENCKRISMPAYPFESDEYWVESKEDKMIPGDDESLAQKKSDIEDWFYYSSWNQTALPRIASDNNGGKIKRLIFVDNRHIGFEIGRKLREKGGQIVFVYPGKKYKKENDLYEIALDDPDSYQSMIKDLVETDMVPDSILHFFGLNDVSDNGIINRIKSVFDFQKYGLFSYLNLVKALNGNNVTKNINLISFVSNALDINGDEAIHPEKSTIFSSTKVIQQEYPNFTNRAVEVDAEFIKNKTGIGLLVNEILSDNQEIICSYRGNKRWVQNYYPIKLNDSGSRESAFKTNGVYFIYGGLTGGMPAIFEYLINKYQARLIVMDDPYLPKEKDWDEWLNKHNKNEYNSLRIKTVKKLKALGAEYIDADIFYGRGDLEKKIKILEAKTGKIDGVIHAAGGYAAGRIAPLSMMDNDLCLYDLSSIGASFIILNDIFKNRKLDFRFLWVSLSNVLAGPSFFAYCAADSIAISAAQKANKNPANPWSIISWDSLETEWDQDLVEENFARIFPSIQKRITEALMTTQEGNNCLEILSGARSQFNPMIISCADLMTRYNIWIKLEKMRASKAQPENSGNKKLKPRPNLSAAYEAPVSDIEKKITGVMGQLLSIENIGRNDNFFDLGGHSLLAIQLASKIREIAQIDWGMEKIFEHQTAADITRFIESKK